MSAAELARKYLQEKDIPILFETMMTGLMFNKPDDPVDFMLRSLQAIRRNPGQKVSWDMFVENPPPPLDPPSSRPGSSRRLMETRLSAVNQEYRKTPPPKTEPGSKPPSGVTRPSSIVSRAKNEIFVDRPLVLLFGGPGGGKTYIADSVCDMMDDPVAHVVLSRAIRNAVDKYPSHKEWKEAARLLESGENIPNELALAVLKDEIGALQQDANIILLEGYPKNLSQVEEFEREIRRVDKAIIIDFDEDTLKSRLSEAGISNDKIEARLTNYKTGTLPAAKYFDDKFVLHLIPGEQDTTVICEQLKNLLISVLYPQANEPEPEPQPEPEPEPVAQKMVNGVSEPVIAEDNPIQAAMETIDGQLSKQANVILVVGAPGSLKSEYCKRICQQFDGMIHLSMGEILRTGYNSNPDDDTWKKLYEHVIKGENVPLDLCRDLMYESMYQYPTAFGFVIEGYPRDLMQAQDFEKTIDRVDLVLLIDCTEQFCMGTLRQRAEQSNESKRADNSPQAVKQRISNFKQHTLPMLKYFDEKGKLRVVEGDKGVDTCYPDVAKVVEEIFIPQESAEGKSLESSKNSK